jgi:hypothetical protein
MDRYANSFNRKVKELINEVAAAYPDDDIIYRTKGRMMLAMDYTPLCMIDIIGPYLCNYRNEINAAKKDANLSLFVNNSFNKEFAESTDVNMKYIATHLMPKVKDLIKKSCIELKRRYINLISLMLDDYMEYSKHVGNSINI